jgi:drug/metabolite transporter (DMT)-like permease
MDGPGEEASTRPKVSWPDGTDLAAAVIRGALLVAPFALWGTSMVAMKGVVPHAAPLMLGALRLVPAGAALLAFALATGRPQPSTPLAWLWILAFTAVDAVAFQARVTLT